MKYGASILYFFGLIAIIVAFSTREYDDLVCNNEPSCSLTSSPGLPQNRLTFEGRDCMCDFECNEYNDCCKDAPTYKPPSSLSGPQKYTCSTKYKIYIRDSCPDGYKDENIKAKCDAASAPTYEDTVYVNPVTNQQKRITYANAFCAVCNDDKDFEPWNLLAGCGEIPESYLTSVSTTSESASKVATSSTSKPDSGKVNVKLHFNPGSILGGNKSADSGINRELNIPTFGFGKALNKTIGSNTGLFGVKFGRSRRDTAPDIDYNKYASQLNDILKNAKYDPNTKRFIANYNGKKFDCKFDFRKPGDQYLRKCVHTLISECPAGQSDANALCQSYTAVVYEKSTKKAYRNKDCALCNGVSKENTTGCPVTTRSEGSSLFSTSSKSAGGAGCSDPAVAAKFC